MVAHVNVDSFELACLSAVCSVYRYVSEQTLNEVRSPEPSKN